MTLSHKLDRLREQAREASANATSRDLADEADRLARDFPAFVSEGWGVADPSPFIPSWHVRVMCERLQALVEGEIPNLCILVPPGLGKSLVASVLLPAFIWIRNPAERFIASSHGRHISVRDTVRSRAVLRSGWYRSRWPHVRLVEDMDTKTRYANTSGGWRVATSTGSGATGERASFLLVDDPHDLSASYYPEQLELARQHYNTVLRSRGAGERTRTLLVMQRVAFDDLAAEVLDQAEQGGEPFSTLILPMRYSPTFSMQLPSGVTYGPDPCDERRPGGTHAGAELLFPDLYPEHVVKRLEISYANRSSAILQQSPSRTLGRMFNVGDLRTVYLDQRDERRYHPEVVLDDPERPRVYQLSECPKIITVDLAVSTRETADYTVIQTWAISPEETPDLMLVDQVRERMEGPDIVPTLKAVYQRWRPARLLVESVGFQLSIIQQARREGLFVEPVKREAGQHKQARAIPFNTLLSEGRVYVRADLPGREDLVRELDQFPNSKHDDCVDAAADAARELVLGHYHVPRDRAHATDYSRFAGPFGPARRDMTTFPEPFGQPVRFDPPTFGGRW